MAKYSQLILYLMLSLLPAGMIFPQQSAVGTKYTHGGINLSLWKGISTQHADSTRRTYLNVGLFSVMNRLDGFGLNVIGASVDKDVHGIQITGLSNVVGGNACGFQFAGITNIVEGNLRGLSASGFVSITQGKVQGLSASGLVNVCTSTEGMAASGLLNFTGGNSCGMQAAGLCNILGENFKGLEVSGLLGVVGQYMKGVQLSGIGNIVAGDMAGVQMAGLGNVTGGTAQGVQLAPVNMAIRAKGWQIGLFNYYKESLDGFQLGLVNANPQTRVQLMVFGGNATKLNVGARFKNKLFYTILGGGSHYLDFSDKFSASLFYRAGLSFPLYKHFSISGDLGYHHIETFKNKNYGIPPRLYALQARINLEYHWSQRLGIFITGGYGGSRYYSHNRTYDKECILEGGIIVF